MAQTSSAAREPSMEEILASIRRIIEDSDVSRQPVPTPPVRGEVAEFRRPVAEKPMEQTEKPAMMRDVFEDEPALRGSIDDLSEKTEEPEDEDEIVLNAENDDRSAMKPHCQPNRKR